MGNLVIDNPNQAISELVSDNEYLVVATSHNTRRAYRADIAHFEKMGGKLPATSQMVASYLKQCATQYNPRTISRRFTAIRQWHKLQCGSAKDPTQYPLVAKTMRGTARLHGKPRRAAPSTTIKRARSNFSLFIREHFYHFHYAAVLQLRQAEIWW